MFGLEKSIHAFDAKLATPTALLAPAEGGLAGRWQAIVDAEHPRFERFGEPERASQIACESISAQAEGRIIGLLDGFGLGVKGAHGRNRRKRLFVHAQSAFGHVRQDRRFKKISRPIQSFTSAKQPRATTQGILDV